MALDFGLPISVMPLLPNLFMTWIKETSLSRQSSRTDILSSKKLTRRISFSSTKAKNKAVADTYQDVLSFLDLYEEPLISAEKSCLVDILQHAELMFAEHSLIHRSCEKGGFIQKLINDIQYALYSKDSCFEDCEKTTISILILLKNMIVFQNREGSISEFQDPEAYQLRQTLLHRYFGMNTQFKQYSLIEIQNNLTELGAVGLIVNLLANSDKISLQIQKRCIQLGIELLNEGNNFVQERFLKYWQEDKALSCQFFRAIDEKLSNVHEELIKMTPITVDSLIQTVGSAQTNLNASNNRGMRRDSDQSSFRSKAVNLPSSLKRELDSAARQTINSLQQRVRSASIWSATAFSVFSKTEKKVENQEVLNHSIPKPQEMSTTMLSLKPTFRFLQLLCENHNKNLQNYLREQTGNKRSYDLISKTLEILDALCGSTTGGLGLLGLYINENNVPVINQTLETLVEYCQGPCHENQSTIANHECNGLDIIIALVLHEIEPLGKTRMDLVLEIKNNASNLLLAIMESRNGHDNAKRILQSVTPASLLKAIKSAYQGQLAFEKTDEDSGFLDDSEGSILSGQEQENIQAVGHNIFILAVQLAPHSEALRKVLNRWIYNQNLNYSDYPERDALQFYSESTAKVEIVREDGKLENIIFPIPSVCKYLPLHAKESVLKDVKRDEQGSKVPEFFEKRNDLYAEMTWQQQLRKMGNLWWIAHRSEKWSSISFQLAVIINLIIGMFYPFDQVIDSKDQTCSEKNCQVESSYFREVIIWMVLASYTISHSFGTWGKKRSHEEEVKKLLAKLSIFTLLVKLQGVFINFKIGNFIELIRISNYLNLKVKKK